MKSFRIVSALLLAGAMAQAQQYVISTVVGIPFVQGCYGDGAAATSGELDRPTQVAVDSKGNIYFVDYYTFIIRMVTASTGFLSTIAGTGTDGLINGTDSNIANCAIATVTGATNSQLGYVHGLAVDNSGNVYFSDTSNFEIRKIDTSTNVTTFAGNNVRGYTGDGGAAAAAELWFPAGLAFDKGGDLYVADYGSSTVRKIDTSGKISTVAGTGSWGYGGDGASASKAALASPVSIAVDTAGNVFIGDTGNANIREITADGNIHTYASNVSAVSLAVDSSDNLYFVDGVSPAVQEILSATGTVLTIAGNGSAGYGGDGGQSTLAQLDHPNGVTLDSKGDVFVSDTNNQIIRELTPVPFSVGAVTNAASSVQAAIAPGEIVNVFGNAIGPSNLTLFTVSNGFIGSQIAGAAVSFNGVPAPLIYTSAGLAAAIVPYEVAGLSTANVTVTYQGNVSATTVVPVTSAATGIFTANMTGSGQAAAVNQNGSLNSASNPAKAGTVISLYVTGEGQTSASIDGKIASAAPYPTPILPVTATVGGQPAIVAYAGGAPTSVAGLMQVNVQIPAGSQAGSAVPVVVSVGSVQSQPGVTIAVTN